MEAIVLTDVDFTAELRALQAEESKDRSEGRHLSRIVHYICERFEPNRFGDASPIDPVLAEGGFLWEQAWSRVMARRYLKTKQIELSEPNPLLGGRPIFMTLDGFDTKAWRVLEFKMTKMSAGNDIRSAKFRHWHMQLMAYCHAMQTREVVLAPMFVNGSYELGGGRFGKPVVGKDGHPFLIRYTEREIVENWRLILMTDRDMEEAA